MDNNSESLEDIFDPYSPVASTQGHGAQVVNPSKVFSKLVEAIERIALDPVSPTAIADAASEDELWALASAESVSAYLASDFARRVWQVMLDHNAAFAHIFVATQMTPIHPAFNFQESDDLRQGYEFFRKHLIERDSVAPFESPTQFVGAIVATYLVAASFVANSPRAAS